MLNAIHCDQCGQAQEIPLLVLPGNHAGWGDGARLVEALFYNAKHVLGEQGWYTSTGYDLCPDCCKAVGKQPGYVENNLKPDTIVIPGEESL